MTHRSKNDRITRNKKECDIETYKTRAEIIAQNPVREGDEDYLRSARVCAIVGISSTTLKPLEHGETAAYPFYSPEQRQLPLAQIRCGSVFTTQSD